MVISLKYVVHCLLVLKTSVQQVLSFEYNFNMKHNMR